MRWDGIGRSQAPPVCRKVPLTFLVSFVRLLPVAMTLPSLTMTHLRNTHILSDGAEGMKCMHWWLGSRVLTRWEPLHEREPPLPEISM